MMKNLFKKLTVLFSAAVLSLSSTALVGAAGTSSSMLFQVDGVMERESERVPVEVDQKLVGGATRYHDHGKEYSELEWILFLSRAVLFHPNFNDFMRIKFCSEVPSGKVVCSQMFGDTWGLYVTDAGTTAVVVCKSITDIDIEQLREYYVSLIGDVKWTQLRSELETTLRNVPNI